MIPTQSLIVFMAASLALNVTPGPDMLYVVARSTSEGRRSGIASALGIGAGTIVHIAVVAAGFGALLAAVPAAYLAVRIAGGSYLIWLGIRALRNKSHSPAAEIEPASLGAVFRQGVVTNVLNPKVALFFLAFLPQFVDASRGNPTLQVIGLGVLFDIQGTIVNIAVAIGASSAARRFAVSTRAKRILDRVTGVVFLGLGARILVAGRK